MCIRDRLVAKAAYSSTILRLLCTPWNISHKNIFRLAFCNIVFLDSNVAIRLLTTVPQFTNLFTNSLNESLSLWWCLVNIWLSPSSLDSWPWHRNTNAISSGPCEQTQSQQKRLINLLNSSLLLPREWQRLTYSVPALISALPSRRVSRASHACARILPAPLPVVEIKDSSQSTVVLCKHDHYHLGQVVQALNKLIQDYQKPFTYKPRREYFVLGFNQTFIFSQVQITWLENLDQRNWNLVCCFISG